jgi:hypothetical protein
MQRIKYKQEDGWFLTDWFNSNAGLVQGKYNVESKAWAVLDHTNKTLFSGKAPSAHKLKMKVKENLIFLGVKFKLEIRKPLIHVSR